VKRIALVAEDPNRWEDRSTLPSDRAGFKFTVHHRDRMDDVQRELREVEGASVLIYDQVCAAEKRRRRKKGDFPAATQRVFTNEQVCEGCGDCGEQSNCTSLLPQPTEYGLKRRVDQSSCNADYSCVKGFCPSFVTVKGVAVRKIKPVAVEPSEADERLPDPVLPPLDALHNILVTGIGGTGVITIGALIGMAAHLEGKGVSVLDMTGMSQKNGSVTSHVRIAHDPVQLKAQRIPTGEADLILGCDMLTAAAPNAIAKMQPGRTYALVNTSEQPTGAFAQDADWVFPADQVRSLITESVGERSDFFDATTLATRLMGDAIAANLFMLGFAFQKGHVPSSPAAILKAIEINGVGIKSNQAAFRWGRKAALDLPAVMREAMPAHAVLMPKKSRTLEALVTDRVAFLTSYQNAEYAHAYRALVGRVQAREAAHRKSDVLTNAVAANLFKLMAYKDEYEVARLYSDGRFLKKLSKEFEGTPRLRSHLAPPALGKRDAAGKPMKQAFGALMLPVFGVLAKLRFLRGTAFDPSDAGSHARANSRLRTCQTGSRRCRRGSTRGADEQLVWRERWRPADEPECANREGNLNATSERHKGPWQAGPLNHWVWLSGVMANSGTAPCHCALLHRFLTVSKTTRETAWVASDIPAVREPHSARLRKTSGSVMSAAIREPALSSSLSGARAWMVAPMPASSVDLRMLIDVISATT